MNNIFNYCGHIISNDEQGRFAYSSRLNVQQAIKAFFKDKSISQCYGSLASGADIMLAKAMFEKGADLHIVIPFNIDYFKETSVKPSGSQWVIEFDQLIEESTSLTQVYYDKPKNESSSFALCTEIAIGLSLLAKYKDYEKPSLQQITIWDKQVTSLEAGTYPDMLRWQSLGLETTYISSQMPFVAQEFNNTETINTQPLNIVIYSHRNPSYQVHITSIKQLKKTIKAQNFDGSIYIDLNKKVFGESKSKKQQNISNRAMGHIVYHCFVMKDYSKNNRDELISLLLDIQSRTPLTNTENIVVTQMDTKNFNFESDIRQLKKVIQINATEAIVFYAGRVLEATSNYCIKQLGDNTGSNVFANIECINDYNLLDQLTRYWAHALRRLSNQFRHVTKLASKQDGQIAVILLDMWIDWLINKSPIVESNNENYSLLSQTHNQTTKQFSWLSQWIKHKDIQVLPDKDKKPLLKEPVFASIICEELINKKEMIKASEYLQIAMDFHPKDLRLNQLKGLYLSRIGELEEAEILLKKIIKQVPNDDETVGILAGVIKKLWQKGDKSRLGHWGKLYLKGWKLSKQKNTYLGINAACYCLWNNNIEQSQKIANDIVNTYIQRKEVLKNKFNYQTKDMDYWDQATLAEAHLLSGNTKHAQESYQILFGSDNFTNMPHEIAATQLKQHLDYQSINTNIFLDMMVEQHAIYD